MIDIENSIVDRIRTALLTDFPNKSIAVLNATPESIAKFPAVCVNELENTTYSRNRDLATQESFADVVYQVDIFVNDGSGAKTFAKQIGASVDKVLYELMFSRPMFTQLPNTDRTIIRYTGRYRAVVAKPKVTEHENGLPDYDYMIYRR